MSGAIKPSDNRRSRVPGQGAIATPHLGGPGPDIVKGALEPYTSGGHREIRPITARRTVPDALSSYNFQ